jgi:hypothetical protein
MLNVCYDEGGLFISKRAGDEVIKSNSVVATVGEKIGVKTRDTEKLQIWKPFELILIDGNVYLKPRSVFVNRDEDVDLELLMDFEENKETVVFNANRCRKTEDIWFSYELGQNMAPVMKYIMKDWQSTGCKMPEEEVSKWCVRLSSWLKSRLACDDDATLVAHWIADELPTVDWRCLTCAMAGLKIDQLTSDEVAIIAEGKVGGHVSHLLAFCYPTQIEGVTMTARQGRVDKGETLLGPQSHSECRVLWPDIEMSDSAKKMPYGAMIQDRYGIDSFIYTIHPGGNASGHVILYPKHTITMTLPQELPSKRSKKKPNINLRGVREAGVKVESTHYFTAYRPSNAMTKPYLLTRKRRDGDYTKAEFADGLDILITPLAADLLREVCCMLRYMTSICRGRGTRKWVDGVCSRIPFAGSWRTLVSSLTNGFDRWLLKYYASLLVSGSPSMQWLTLIEYHTSKNSIDGQFEDFVTSRDAIIASLLYNSYIGNESVRTTNLGDAMDNLPRIQELKEDTLVIHEAYYQSGVWIEWPTCKYYNWPANSWIHSNSTKYKNNPKII